MERSNVVVLRLRIPVNGSRFNSVAGETRTLIWRQTVPRVVAQSRAGDAIDWGGAMVRFGDYEMLERRKPPNVRVEPPYSVGSNE
jgi:hypothetical protein